MKILLQILFFTSFMMADTQTIAISYFDNTSGLEEYNPLSKGLADMLITDLSNVKSIQIVEREKLESLLKEIELGEGKFMDESTAQKLGKGLGAGYMLTGSYLIMGETMRIDARLVNVATGKVAMGEEITGEKNTFFELEKDLVQKLILALNLSLSKSEERRVKKVQTESFDSFNAYSASLDSYDKGEYEESQKFLEKAVEIDTDFDVAWDKLDALQEELEQLLAAREIKLSTEIIKIMDDLVNNDKESCETFINMYDNITSRIKWHLWSEDQYEGSLYDKRHKEDISNSFSKLMKIYKYMGTKNYQIDICENITSNKDRGAFQRGSSNQFEKMWDNSYLLEDFLVNIIFFEAKTSDSLMVNDLDNNNRNIKNVIDDMIIYFGQKLIKSFPNRDKYSSDKTLMLVERAIYRKKHSEPNSSWIFVANEGNYGASNGSVTMIDDKGQITTIDNIGDVVQSVEVYKNKLFVIVNNSHKIMIYNITENGVDLPGIEISTENSSPREMVIVNDKVYFTNWNSMDVKILNLTTYAIDSSIPIEGLPEDIITDGINLWVSVPHLELNDPSDGTKVLKINLESEQIVDTYEVGRGPQSLTLLNDDIYVSRTYYSSNWTETTFGVSKIGEVITEAIYGLGAPCGGSIMTFDNKVYRSYEGGIAPIDDNLEIQSLERIGTFDQSQVYHVEIINDYIYFTLTDYSTMNMLKKVDSNGTVISSYNVGINPGDLAYWNFLSNNYN